MPQPLILFKKFTQFIIVSSGRREVEKRNE
jgi:hypothetical protein